MQLLRHKFVLLIGVTAITLFLASCHQPVAVDNHSFETPVVASGAQLVEQGETLGAWEVTQGSVDLVSDLWQAQEGRQSLDLTGVSPGAIAQDLTTVVGQRYAIVFSLAGNPLSGKYSFLKTPFNPGPFFPCDEYGSWHWSQ